MPTEKTFFKRRLKKDHLEWRCGGDLSATQLVRILQGGCIGKLSVHLSLGPYDSGTLVPYVLYVYVHSVWMSYSCFLLF